MYAARCNIAQMVGGSAVSQVILVKRVIMLSVLDAESAALKE